MATNYESEITQFLKDFKQSHPGTEERQREGRARLWDKPQDAELLEGFRAAVSYTHLDVYKRQSCRWSTPR